MAPCSDSGGLKRVYLPTEKFFGQQVIATSYGVRVSFFRGLYGLVIGCLDDDDNGIISSNCECNKWVESSGFFHKSPLAVSLHFYGGMSSSTIFQYWIYVFYILYSTICIEGSKNAV